MAKRKQQTDGALPGIKFDAHNFRKHSAENKKMIHDSLAELGAGRSVVVDKENELIAGNGVYEQAQKLGMPVRIVETDGTELVVVKRTDLATDDIKRKKLAAADNATSDNVEWNAEELRLHLDAPTIEALHIELPPIEPTFNPDEFGEPKQNDAAYIAMLDNAYRHAIAEIMDAYEKIGGWQFVRKGCAEVEFVNFVHNGGKYKRSNAIAFHPAMEHVVNGSKQTDIIQEYTNEGNGTGKIYGVRYLLDGGTNWPSLYGCSQGCEGVKRVLDFPAELARDLINEFAPQGGKVLDPCAGWGGRLVGFLASHAGFYVATDPAPAQIEGNTEIYNRFAPYCKTEHFVELNCTPFEEYESEQAYFDFALTSPPYFDVEKYHGGKQSHETFDNYAAWRDGFYTQLITRVHGALKPGGVFALQVGSQRYPLLKDARKIAKHVGFAEVETRSAGMENSTKTASVGEDQEVILILKKTT